MGEHIRRRDRQQITALESPLNHRRQTLVGLGHDGAFAKLVGV
ncbi:hypothetical protein [Salinisphaera sp.]